MPDDPIRILVIAGSPDAQNFFTSLLPRTTSSVNVLCACSFSVAMQSYGHLCDSIQLIIIDADSLPDFNNREFEDFKAFGFNGKFITVNVASNRDNYPDKQSAIRTAINTWTKIAMDRFQPAPP